MHIRLILPLLAACMLATSCEDPPRVPYIKPDLAAWPTPYVGTKGVAVHVFETGKLRVPEPLLRRGGNPSRTRDVAVTSIVVQHPREGLIVINPGLTAESKTLSPSGTSLLQRMLASEALPGKTLAEQMRTAGLDADAVRWVLLSSLTPSHSASIADFPKATVIVTRAAHVHARDAVPAVPIDRLDESERWRLLEFADTPRFATFPHHIDVFADGSVLAIEAAGALPGVAVFLLRLPQRPVLLAAGLAEFEDQVRFAAQPGTTHDFDQWWQRIWELKRFRDLVPELLVVPGGDTSGLAALDAAGITIHPTPQIQLPTPKVTPEDPLRRMLR